MRPGSVSVVIGASRGIGRALASALAARGGDVVAVGSDQARIDAVLPELQESGPAGRHRTLAADVAVERDMDGVAGLCDREYGRVDLLVVSAVAAGYEGLPPATRDLPLAAWQRSLDVNLNGVFLANRAILPLMLAREDGDILNICSALTPHGLAGRALAPAYSATKFAVAAFTRQLAAEVADRGVRVNALFPGTVETPLIRNTALSAAFGGQIAVENFAAAVIGLLDATVGAYPADPFILPMRTGGR